ncbi:MAG: signal peptidase II [Desulfobacterales bacterium]|nr:signal peptidase II [Desulfobacterales bacterium]
MVKLSRTDYAVFALAVLVVVADQLTKLWVHAVFQPFEVKIVIPGFFNLVLVSNTGAAFGLLSGEQTMARQLFFVVVAVIALGVMIFSYRHFKASGRIFAYAVGLIAGGAMGNLIDRLRFGAVTDFLDFHIKDYHWPAFNLADSAITIGVGLFLVGFWLDGKQQPADRLVSDEEY